MCSRELTVSLVLSSRRNDKGLQQLPPRKDQQPANHQVLRQGTTADPPRMVAGSQRSHRKPLNSGVKACRALGKKVGACGLYSIPFLDSKRDENTKDATVAILEDDSWDQKPKISSTKQYFLIADVKEPETASCFEAVSTAFVTESKSCVVLHLFGTRPNCRRAGHGSKLVELIEDGARSKGLPVYVEWVPKKRGEGIDMHDGKVQFW